MPGLSETGLMIGMNHINPANPDNSDNPGYCSRDIHSDDNPANPSVTAADAVMDTLAIDLFLVGRCNNPNNPDICIYVYVCNDNHMYMYMNVCMYIKVFRCIMMSLYLYCLYSLLHIACTVQGHSTY